MVDTIVDHEDSPGLVSQELDRTPKRPSFLRQIWDPILDDDQMRSHKLAEEIRRSVALGAQVGGLLRKTEVEDPNPPPSPKRVFPPGGPLPVETDERREFDIPILQNRRLSDNPTIDGEIHLLINDVARRLGNGEIDSTQADNELLHLSKKYNF